MNDQSNDCFVIDEGPEFESNSSVVVRQIGDGIQIARLADGLPVSCR